MSDLVKTIEEIVKEDTEITVSNFMSGSTNLDRVKEFENQKVLVLPSGLDVLEEMLKKELERLNKTQSQRLYGTQAYYSQAIRESKEAIYFVFARFKQEHGVD
jgi:hypothetical protein